MREIICRIFELICEKTSSHSSRVQSMFFCAATCEVDELIRVDDGGGGDAFDCCAEVQEEGGFFGGDVGGHAAVWEGKEEVRKG